MRLNKILADAGVASRRGAERLLAEGRVTVNGAVVTAPGAAADPERDTITVDGKPLRVPAARPEPIYVMLHKPPGVLTTARDPEGRPTARELVDRPERLFTVGRLDRDTEGLLLLTNDGEWANRVAHPSGGVEKEYEAIVDGVPSDEALARFEEGIELPDGYVAHGTARFVEAVDGRARLRLTLHEGHKRQARLMFGAIGHPVRRLVRVRIGGLHLGALTPGAWRLLRADEVAAVLRGESPRGTPERRDGDGDRANRAKGRDGQRERRPGNGHTGDTSRAGHSDGERRERAAFDRDRRAGRVGQVDDRPRSGARPGPALPRHRRDVPRGDVAGPPEGHRPVR